jgi:aerobic-type carbon monoxide dehydrogenase small subunit (CoxS/CutS family)
VSAPRASAGSTPGSLEIDLVVNGETLTVCIDAAERLLDVLRQRLGLTGTKEGCGEGECGACTVLLDGLPVNSCLVPAWQARGSRVATVEAVDPARLGALLRSGATQCGACTPGVVMTALWIADHREHLARQDVRELMAGNLCRCTGYDGIVEGIEQMLGEAEG